jgi:electron transport complex protein RnfD
MLDVVIALVPAMAAAIYFFRVHAAIVILACVGSCVLTEYACTKIRKKPCTVDDFSAVVTGIILALSLPPAAPWWLAALGGFFAITIGKVVFGGLGANMFNPAMASRAFLTASFGALMTTWTVPAVINTNMPDVSADNPTAITQATPLSWAKQALRGEADVQVVKDQLKNAFLGSTAGCLGETSTIALLIGGIYLLLRGTIPIHVPLAIFIAVIIYCEAAYFIFRANISPIAHLTTGALVLCMFFIATDPVTMPLSAKGMWIFGLGVGLLIMLIRTIGEYPEGVMYAVLIMNAFSPLIDRYCKLVPAGGKPSNE